MMPVEPVTREHLPTYVEFARIGADASSPTCIES